MTLTNTIVANSTTGGDCYGGVTDGGHHLIEDVANACGLSNGVNGNIVGVAPLLDPAGLKDNGGPTHTIELEPGSPAINAGDPEVCANRPVSGVDQRGYARPGLGSVNCSIGAYEAEYPLPTPTSTVTPTATPNATPTLTPTNTPTPTPRRSESEDGCTMTPTHDHRAAGWFLLVPAMALWWVRRRAVGTGAVTSDGQDEGIG